MRHSPTVLHSPLLERPSLGESEDIEREEKCHFFKKYFAHVEKVLNGTLSSTINMKKERERNQYSPLKITGFEVDSLGFESTNARCVPFGELLTRPEP